MRINRIDSLVWWYPVRFGVVEFGLVRQFLGGFEEYLNHNTEDTENGFPTRSVTQSAIWRHNFQNPWYILSSNDKTVSTLSQTLIFLSVAASQHTDLGN